MHRQAWVRQSKGIDTILEATLPHFLVEVSLLVISMLEKFGQHIVE
jgi:hypothetical protein